jgi:hypothetical protein
LRANATLPANGISISTPSQSLLSMSTVAIRPWLSKRPALKIGMS